MKDGFRVTIWLALVLGACGGEPAKGPPITVVSPAVDEAAASAASAAPDAQEGFKKVAVRCCSDAGVAAVIEAELSLFAALAADDLAASTTAATTLDERVQRAAGDPAGDQAAKVPLAALAVFTSQLPRAPDLKEMRASVAELGAPTEALLRLGGGGDKTIALAFCPMAPEPGLWIQEKGPIQNPFYGSDMLTCGTFQGVAQAGGPPAPSGG